MQNGTSIQQVPLIDWLFTLPAVLSFAQSFSTELCLHVDSLPPESQSTKKEINYNNEKDQPVKYC